MNTHNSSLFITTLLIVLLATLVGGNPTNASAKEHLVSTSDSSLQQENQNQAKNDLEYVPNQVIVGLNTHTAQSDLLALKAEMGAVTLKSAATQGIEVWQVEGLTVEQAVERYRDDNRIKYIEPNYIKLTDTFPNDPNFSDLWGLNNTGQTGGTADAPLSLNSIPDINVNPMSLAVTLAEGDSTSKILTISNQGSGTLNWNISTIVGEWMLHYDWLCDGDPSDAIWTFYEDFTFTASGGSSGTWLLSGNQIVITYSSGTEYTGTLNYDSMAGTMISSGITGCWTADRVMMSGYVTLHSGEYTDSGEIAEEPRATTKYFVNSSNWLNANLISGTEGAGAWTDVTVDIDATSLTAGTYNETLTITSNDSDEAIIQVPVTLTVIDMTFLVCEDFESGSLPSYMFTETTTNGSANGRVQVTSNNPYVGSYALDLDTDCNGCGDTQQAAIMMVDLGGASQVELNFWVREYDDENHAEDGLFISDDGGSTWAQIASFNDYPDSYTNVVIDLTSAASAAGMSLVDDFMIKFQSYDNYTIPSDGYSFDYICLSGIRRGQVALISDRTELTAITGILDSMGLSHNVLNNNWDGSQGIYTSDESFLSNYDAVIWYASGTGSGRLTTQQEHDALESYLQAGGHLLVTGFDTLGNPADTLLADIVRSTSTGDGPFIGDHTVTDGSHPIMNGPYGTFPTGTALAASHTDHDQAEADSGRGAVTVAELSDGHDKIIATELSPFGRVVYWNGNYNVTDWTGTASLTEPLEHKEGLPDSTFLSNEELLAQAQQSAKEGSADANYNGDGTAWHLESDIVRAIQSARVPLSSSSTFFPASGDTMVVQGAPWWWHAGDYVEGVRALSLATVKHLDYSLIIQENTLNGSGHVDFDLSINGTVVGSFTVLPGELLKNLSFDFLPISGPNYTIRLEETNTVDSLMGSIVLPLDVSTIELSNGPQRDIFKNTLTWLTSSDCTTYASTDVPLSIPDSGSMTSVLNVAESGTIADINVLDLNGTHTYMGDLDFFLDSPATTQVQLMAQACGGNDNFDLNLDDEAAPGPWPCPPTDGGTYQPTGSLSDFDGEDSAGTWTLTIVDNAGGDSGQLDGWSLEICTGGAPLPPVIEVEPDSLASTQESDQQIVQTLTVSNTGASNLNWTIDEDSSLLPSSANSILERIASGAQPTATIEVLTMPPVNNEALLAEDRLNIGAGVAPRFALPLPVTVSPATHGTWESLDDDTLLWRLRIQSPGAVSLNFGFTRYVMPKGGSLLLWTPDMTTIRGPFTAEDNEIHGELWTPILSGDDVIIALQIPAAKQADLELLLSSVNHGYTEFGRAPLSGSCNVDVVCSAADGFPEIDGWRDEIRSVVVFGMNGSIFCTGALINNTAQDLTPYILTATPCGINASNAASLVTYWNHENSTCRPPGSAASGGPGDGTLNQFNTGSFFRASHSPSAMTLVELDDPIDSAFNVHWAGWDATSNDASAAVSIHHPDADEKRISFEHDPTSTTSYGQSTIPGDGTHVRVADWDLGTTELNSTGAPLFNPEKRIIGQLHGGNAACGNDDANWYGRLDVSWTGGGTAATRLMDWLDPTSSGILTLDGRDETDGGVQCSAPSDIPWANLSPTSGTTLPGGSDAVDVTFDSTGLAMGTYTGRLCINSNDPVTPLVVVPLQMTVEDSQPAVISDIRQSNVRDVSFTVSWLTDIESSGLVRYGTSPSNLNQTAVDERGAATFDDTHYVIVNGLQPDTTYYFDVVSGSTTDDNGGAHYSVTTGSVIGLPSSDTINGQVFKEDGTTVAEGTIVYITLSDANGAGTSGQAALLSSLVNSAGYWGTNLGNARTPDLSDYFVYSASGDRVGLEAIGAADGVGCERVDTANDTPAASITLNVSDCTITWPMSLQSGWSHISLPIDPLTPLTAADACDEINNQGGSAIEIDRWHNGGWDGHTCGVPFNDFDLVLGSDYFIKSSSPSTWELVGDEVLAPVPLDIQVGWNSIGIPHTDAYSAESLCDEMIDQGVTALEIDRWHNGGWDGHLCGLPFNDFDIERGTGYFVKSSSAGTVIPDAPATSLQQPAQSLPRSPDSMPVGDSMPVRDLRIGNKTDSGVTLSWLTEQPTTGYVLYGETAEMGQVAVDVRGAAVSAETHLVTLTNLKAETSYYFKVVSGVEDESAPSTFTTAPSLENIPASDTVYGQVFKADGETPATGTLVYLRLQDSDGVGSSGEATLLSALVDDEGYWHANLGNARLSDFSDSFSYSASDDDLVIEAQGASSLTVSTSNDAQAPDMILDETSDPTSVTVGEINSMSPQASSLGMALGLLALTLLAAVVIRRRRL